MAGSGYVGASDCGISTNGVLNDGMELHTAGRACIDRLPFAYMRLNVYPQPMSESRKGVYPFCSLSS